MGPVSKRGNEDIVGSEFMASIPPNISVKSSIVVVSDIGCEIG